MNIYDIMIDVDDVIFPLIDSIHNIAFDRGLHDGTRPAENWVGWEQYGCTEEVYWDLWADFALADGYRTTAPIPGAAEAVRRLRWEGHRIHVVTARGFLARADEIRSWTPEWLETYGIPHDTLTFAQDKVAAQEEIGARFDFAIDDRFGTVEKLRADGVGAYLMHHGHNAQVETDLRVYTMDEFVDVVLAEASA